MVIQFLYTKFYHNMLLLLYVNFFKLGLKTEFSRIELRLSVKTKTINTQKILDLEEQNYGKYFNKKNTCKNKSDT